MEHITIYVKNGEITKAYFSSHGDKKWFQPNELEIEDKTHVVVYSALSSHASYNKPSWFFRYFCFANDYTNTGIRWDANVEIINDTTWWNTFDGWMGYPDNVKMPSRKDDWNVEF